MLSRSIEMTQIVNIGSLTCHSEKVIFNVASRGQKARSYIYNPLSQTTMLMIFCSQVILTLFTICWSEALISTCWPGVARLHWFRVTRMWRSRRVFTGRMSEVTMRSSRCSNTSEDLMMTTPGETTLLVAVRVIKKLIKLINVKY